MRGLRPKHRDDDVNAIDPRIGDEWVLEGGGIEPVEHHGLERFWSLASARCDENWKIRSVKTLRQYGARLS